MTCCLPAAAWSAAPCLQSTSSGQYSRSCRTSRSVMCLPARCHLATPYMHTCTYCCLLAVVDGMKHSRLPNQRACACCCGHVLDMRYYYHPRLPACCAVSCCTTSSCCACCATGALPALCAEMPRPCKGACCCVHAHVRARACVRACVCACVRACVCVCVCACVHVCAHMCVCVHACVLW
jgi:hypothetical protein